jgi:hypothetical protein
MQISRHWRLNAQRYRLEGVRYENGEVSLQSRLTPLENADNKVYSIEVSTENEKVKVPAR